MVGRRHSCAGLSSVWNSRAAGQLSVCFRAVEANVTLTVESVLHEAIS